jgi:trans-aconitate 2-methyltransferase
MKPLKSYGWDAKDYAINSQNQFNWAKELIPKLHLTGNESVLDVGCGDGKVTVEIAHALPKGKVVGVDSSPNMINLAKTNFPQERYPNLSFMHMDAQQLLFKEEFNCVFSNAALHWVKNHKPVLAGVYQSLKPGGRLLFQMGGKGSSQSVIDSLDKLKTTPKYQSYFSDFTFPYFFPSGEEYIPLLLEAHLTPKRVELIGKDMKFPDVQGLMGWIRTTWLPFTERVPVGMRENFIKEIADGYIQSHPAYEDGSIHVVMMRLEVEAEKA